MKILHTADWHFGKQLYKHTLHNEMQLFLDWVLEVIRTQEIDVLLISGDIFDVTNPSNFDKEQYFNFLRKIRSFNIKTIITGGNHDSIGLLNASKTYLHQDDIFVVGGGAENLSDEIIELNIKEESVVICAVPFLRDKDLRHQETDKKFESRHEAIQFGLQEHYKQVLQLAKEQNNTVPVIAMGHLFAIGSSTSESERDIHIGNAGAVSHTIFNGFDYVALGHIHKPQIINKNEMIRYSGSPIPLSFSEKTDVKQVVIIEIEDNKIKTPEIVKVPKSRGLLRFSGTLSEVKEKSLQTNFNEHTLPPFIEVAIKEPQYDLEKIQEMNLFVDAFNQSSEAQIVHSKIEFKEGQRDISQFLSVGASIENLDTKEVFDKRMQSAFPDADDQKQKDLKATFSELLELYYTNED